VFDCGCPEGVFCKHRQLRGMRSGMGQKNKPSDELIAKDVKHNKQRSQAQERDVAGKYKDAGFQRARRQPSSGALHEALLFADVDPGERWLVEAKQSRSGKLVLEPDWLKKIKEEAASQNRKPLLHAAVAAGEEHYERWVALPEEDWFDLIKELKDLEDEVDFARKELTKND
jgi:Holliday junction resolvase